MVMIADRRSKSSETWHDNVKAVCMAITSRNYSLYLLH